MKKKTENIYKKGRIQRKIKIPGKTTWLPPLLGLGPCWAYADDKFAIWKNSHSPLFAGIVKEIKAMTTKFSECSFIFEGRETNYEAHSLAQHTLGFSLGGHLWLFNPPDLNWIPMYLDIDQ